MRYSTVIFDLDGTLLYTLEDLWLSTNHALAQCGLPTITLNELRCYVGNGYLQLFEEAVPTGTAQELIHAALEKFHRYYLAHSQDHTVAYPGIPELLESLKEEGAKLAVVSNKGDQAVQELIEFYFPQTFDAVVGEREGVRRKPWPDGPLAVIDKLGTTIEKSVYVGDSEVDIRTAEALGCDCIIVSWGYREEAHLRSEGAGLIVHNVDELKEALCSELPA